MKHEERKEIVSQYGAQLAEPTDEQREYMLRKAVKHQIYYSSAERLWCTNCGHRFSLGNGKELPNHYGVYQTCPQCGLRLETCKTFKKTCHEDGYALIMETIKDWQILRYFYLENDNYIDGYTFSKKAKITYAPSKDCTEVMRIWINPTKKQSFTQRVPLHSFPNYRRCPYSFYDSWNGVKNEMKICSTAMERSEWSTEWMRKTIVPGAKILPYFKKRGLNTRNAVDLYTDLFMQKVDKIPYAETLLKMGQIRLANLFVNNDYQATQNERQIRIALRHGFDFQHMKGRIKDYFDYLGDLRTLGRDDTNPQNLVPANFGQAHIALADIVLERRQREWERRERELAEKREIEEIKRSEKLAGELEKRKTTFGKLEIIGFGLIIRPLFTRQEYQEEGKAMHHCVGGYWDRFDSLILSARDKKGDRVETIEVSLKNWTIVQSRAVCNGTSKKHREILELVKKNIPTIKKMALAS